MVPLRLIYHRDVSYDIKVWSVRGLEYASDEMGADENLTERENGYRLHLEFYSDRIEITEEQQKLSVRNANRALMLISST